MDKLQWAEEVAQEKRRLSKLADNARDDWGSLAWGEDAELAVPRPAPAEGDVPAAYPQGTLLAELPGPPSRARAELSAPPPGPLAGPPPPSAASGPPAEPPPRVLQSLLKLA